MLDIAPTFSLPLEAVTRTFGLLAMRGAGKSNAAVKMAEEMYDAHIPWVAIDPKGDWWGIRSSRDGKQPGLEVVIFGGEHGDLPLEPTAGKVIAALVARERVTCVLDLSEFASKAEQSRFLTDFAQELYRRNREPLHLFLDEADEYVPQRVFKDMAQCVGAWSKMIKLGRNRGIGMTVISQRSAVINKDVLTQLDNLIPLRTTSPQDRKAILAWVEHHALGREIVDELPTLEDGEAWLWSPHWLKTVEKIKFHQRRTFDSGATPELGKGRPSARLADIDLSKLRDEMASTIEKAEANDPDKLKRTIASQKADLIRLEAELRARPAVAAEPTVVEVEVIPTELRDLVHSIESGMSRVEAGLAELGELAAIRAKLAGQARDLIDGTPKRTPKRTPPRTEPAAISPPRRSTPPPERTAAPPVAASDVALGLAERKIVAVLLAHGDRTKRQLALQANYSAAGGGFNNALGRLRSAGIISAGGDPIRLLAVPDPFVPPEGFDASSVPTGGAELLEHWLNRTGPGRLGKAEKAILSVLWEHPRGLDKATLGTLTDYAPEGGGFNNALGRLRTLELVEGGGRSDPTIRLIPDFFTA